MRSHYKNKKRQKAFQLRFEDNSIFSWHRQSPDDNHRMQSLEKIYSAMRDALNLPPLRHRSVDVCPVSEKYKPTGTKSKPRLHNPNLLRKDYSSYKIISFKPNQPHKNLEDSQQYEKEQVVDKIKKASIIEAFIKKTQIKKVPKAITEPTEKSTIMQIKQYTDHRKKTPTRKRLPSLSTFLAERTKIPRVSSFKAQISPWEYGLEADQPYV